ncbi:FAD-binding oxidoreductase [Paracoccus sp. Z118]|uniref:NAD(P)/FAD-dependent oxidoreductase n=1 Tax=Paracoccus sp. Z118 TaxID=2851017 RepID=UPI001C2B79B4|nr:FAD-binding oxidoreductase [Paracoccus sp. Z118]
MARAVTVIGAGIFGLSCAWELTRRGARVRVIEARRIGAGSSGGTVGALAPHAPENWNAKKQMQLEALVAAEGWWAEVAASGGVDPGYARTGRVQPVADPAQAEARVAAAACNWPAPFRMALTDAPRGLGCDSPSGLYLTDNLTARLSPRRAGAALAAAIRAAGGEVQEDAGPQTPERVEGPAVWATGAEGLAALSADLGREMGGGVKGQSALLAHAAPDAPQVFAEGLHVVPHADGTVAVGSTSEREFTDPQATDAQLEALIERARALCPALKDAPVVDRWAGVRPRAVSRAPLLGKWPGRPGHFVVNGGFKIGFGMAPVVGAMMADLVLTGEDRIPEGFRLA